jgi:hypothetical protein
MISPSQLGRHAVLFLLQLAASVSIGSPASAQTKSNVHPVFADTTGESDVYPIGDAVGVYRAILDLLYVDGKQRPPSIIMWDSAMRFGSGPCPLDSCRDAWIHQSKIDTATLLAFARQSFKRPRIIDFGYGTKIVRVSQNDFERLRNDGYGYLADRPPEKVGPIESFWAGFRGKFPRAWGYVALSKVGFNPAHTEALIGVFQNCGESCRSNEIIFLKRAERNWKVIERIPDEVEVFQTAGNLRYRGPAAEKRGQSQIVALDSTGSGPRAESDDATSVYGVVLDRLYSFYGESPQSLVLTENRAWGPGGLPPHRSKIDSSTISGYNLFAQVRDAVPRFKYRIPIIWVNDAVLKDLERTGASLAKAAAERYEEETSPLWYGFQLKYPGAWGYVSLGRVSFNPEHTQALVSTKHVCGSNCFTADTWFLERKNDNWYVVERMPRDNGSNFPLDGLRYLGTETDPHAYRLRRIHGVFTDDTGKPLSALRVEVRRFTTSLFFDTDGNGQNSLENLPHAPFELMVRCPPKSASEWAAMVPVSVRPGLDSTVNVRVESCPQQ